MEPKELEIANLGKGIGTSTVGGQATDFEQYRLSQNFEDLVGIKKETLIVPVRKPERQSWFQIHPGEDWRMPVALIEVKEDRQHYLVAPTVYNDLAGECTPKYLITCQTRQKITFLWPVRMPAADGRMDQWSASALQIVNEYAGRWIRVSSNLALGAYEVFVTEAPFDPPIWPPEGFHSILEKAFRGRIIDSVDHPIVKMLRGVM